MLGSGRDRAIGMPAGAPLAGRRRCRRRERPFSGDVFAFRGKRGDLIDHLRNLDIETGIHFVPVHRHTHFANCRTGDLSVTEKVVGEVLTLPLHSNMRPEFVERVIKGVVGFFA